MLNYNFYNILTMASEDSTYDFVSQNNIDLNDDLDQFSYGKELLRANTNDVNALLWILKSYSSYKVLTSYYLARIYENGYCGVERNLNTAFSYMTESAMYDFDLAQKDLSIYYLKGIGCEINEEKYLYWLKKSNIVDLEVAPILENASHNDSYDEQTVRDFISLSEKIRNDANIRAMYATPMKKQYFNKLPENNSQTFVKKPFTNFTNFNNYQSNNDEPKW